MDLITKRKEKGYTQQTLADAAGVHYRTISKMELGNKALGISLENSKKIADALNVDLNTFYELVCNIQPSHKVGNPNLKSGQPRPYEVHRGKGKKNA